MNTVAKITHNEDGYNPDGGLWHVIQGRDSNRIYCSGEAVNLDTNVASEGNSFAVTKEVKRGGITCEECLTLIAEIKSIKL